MSRHWDELNLIKMEFDPANLPRTMTRKQWQQAHRWLRKANQAVMIEIYDDQLPTLRLISSADHLA